MESYLVIDVESDGPSVLTNSMFAVGGHLIRKHDKTILGSFKYKIADREGCVPDKDTFAWWNSPEQLPVYKQLTDDQRVEPLFAANQLKQFIQEARKISDIKFMFASDCSVYDWKFVDTYLHQYTGINPLGYSAFDMYSYVSGMLKCSRMDAWKEVKAMEGVRIVKPSDNVVHNHDPYQDALYEAVQLIDLMRLNEGLSWIPLRFGSSGNNVATTVENESVWYL
jgi:hypothetical protein